jgi:hypothetical protein
MLYFEDLRVGDSVALGSHSVLSNQAGTPVLRLRSLIMVKRRPRVDVPH